MKSSSLRWQNGAGRTVCYLLAAGLLLAASVAAAEERPVPAAEALTPSEVAGSAGPVTQDKFDVAVRLLVEGEIVKAEEVLGELAADPGDPQRAAQARNLLGRLQRARLAKEQAAVPSDRQEGRTALLATSTAAGLILYGAGIPEILDIEDDRATIGLFMVTAGASFLVPYFVTADAPVSWGMANLAFSGATRGAAHGALLALALTDNPTTDQSIGSAMALSAAEMVAATWYGHSAGLSAGDAHLLGVGADFGAVWLAGYAATASWEAGGNQTQHTVTGTALAGAALGFAAGEFYRDERQMTWGDAEFLRMSGLVGGFAGVTLSDWLGLMDSQTGERYISSIAVTGSIAGVVLGDFLGHDQDFSVGQSLLVDLGTVTGGLLAAGLTYLIGDFDGTTPYLTAGLLGSATGYGLSYFTHAKPIVKRTAGWLERHLQGLPVPQLSPWAGQDGARGLALATTF